MSLGPPLRVFLRSFRLFCRLLWNSLGKRKLKLKVTRRAGEAGSFPQRTPPSDVCGSGFEKGWAARTRRSCKRETASSSPLAEDQEPEPTAMIGELKVKMLSGQELLVPVRDSTQMAELKQHIAQKTRVPAFQQRLIAHPSGAELRDDVPLFMQNLRPGGTVLLVVLSDDPQTILVRNEKGHVKAYDVRLTQTVFELKLQVSQQERMPADLFWLSFKGNCMEDPHQLGEYGLSPHCTVFVNLRLRGGGAGPEGRC